MPGGSGGTPRKKEYTFIRRTKLNELRGVLGGLTTQEELYCFQTNLVRGLAPSPQEEREIVLKVAGYTALVLERKRYIDYSTILIQTSDPSYYIETTGSFF